MSNKSDPMLQTKRWYIKLARGRNSLDGESEKQVLSSTFNFKMKLLIVLVVIGVGVMLYDFFTDVAMTKRGGGPSAAGKKRKQRARNNE